MTVSLDLSGRVTVCLREIKGGLECALGARSVGPGVESTRKV